MSVLKRGTAEQTYGYALIGGETRDRNSSTSGCWRRLKYTGKAYPGNSLNATTVTFKKLHPAV